MLPIQPLFSQFLDLDGSPLDDGRVWFGQPDQNPETAPIVAYWDADGTQPVAQPLRIKNGFPVYRGAAAQVHVAGDHSCTIKDRKGRLVAYRPRAEMLAAINQARIDLDAAQTAQARALQAFTGGQDRGDWTAATAYQAGQIAWVGNVGYQAKSTHTSAATFAADLAAGKWVVFQGLTRQELADTDIVDLSLTDYTALRAYSGNKTRAYITGVLGTAAAPGISGVFVRHTGDTTSADNGGTIIRDALGRRWRRVFDGHPSVRFWGATGLGVDDDYQSFASAITAVSGKSLFVPSPAGAYKIGTAQLLIPDNTKIIGESDRSTKLTHAFNGDMFLLGDGASLENLFIEGDGGVFTGGCFVYSGSNGRQKITNLRAINFDGPVQYFDTDAGSQSSTFNCTFSRTGAATGTGRYAVVISPVQKLGAVPRKFSFIETNGTPAFDFGGSNDTFVSCSFLGDLKYTDESRGVLVTSCRVSNQVSLTVSGHNNVISACDLAPKITISSGSDNIAIGPNSYNNLPIIDNSGNNRNHIDHFTISYDPVLQSGGAQPVIGNGSIAGEFARSGSSTMVSGQIVVGNTTSLGTGGLQISLPHKRHSGDIFVGGVVYLNRGGVVYSGFLQIAGADTKASFLRDQTGSITFNSPAIFSAGDIIRWSATYKN